MFTLTPNLAAVHIKETDGFASILVTTVQDKKLEMAIVSQLTTI